MKLLIVLADDLFIRNYLETNAFAGLERHECHFAVAEQCKNKAKVEALPNFRGTIRVSPELEQQHDRVFRILLWRNRERSRTFYYRFSRAYRTHRKPTPRNVAKNLRGYVGTLKYRVWGSRLVASRLVPRLTERIPVNHDLEQIVDSVKPDLMIFPSSAYDPIGNDVARLGHSLGIRSLFLVDNWDNLTSKSVLWAPPDHLTVWGEQSKRHAIEIHGVAAERIHIIGTPRFEQYYRADRETASSHYPFPYILFCGSALAFDELSALRALDRELDENADVYAGTKIIYRPHPWRQPRFCPDVFREADFKHVQLDDQVRDAYYRIDLSFQPSLDYYPALLTRAKLVVGPLTTMLVEALLCGTPVLAITYDDRVHYTSPHNALKYYRHFEGIERIAGLSFNRSQAALGADLRRLLSTESSVSRRDILDSLQYFIHNDERPYSARLREVVDDILQPATRGARP